MSFNNYTKKELSGIRNHMIPEVLIDTLKLDYDHPILIVGKEGVGKSTLAILLADLLIKTRNKIEGTDDKLVIDNILYYDLTKLIKDVFSSGRSGDVRLIDEGAITGAYKREAMSKDNRSLNKTLMTCRSRNQILIILVPNINSVDRDVLDRCKTIIRVVNRGHAWLVAESEKNTCIKWNPRTRRLYFKQRPHFHLEKYRDVKTILGENIWKEYIEHKETSLRGDEPESESSSTDKRYRRPREIKEIFGISQRVIKELAKSDKIDKINDGYSWLYDIDSVRTYLSQKGLESTSNSTIVGEYGRKESEK